MCPISTESTTTPPTIRAALAARAAAIAQADRELVAAVRSAFSACTTGAEVCAMYDDLVDVVPMDAARAWPQIVKLQRERYTELTTARILVYRDGEDFPAGSVLIEHPAQTDPDVLREIVTDLAINAARKADCADVERIVVPGMGLVRRDPADRMRWITVDPDGAELGVPPTFSPSTGIVAAFRERLAARVARVNA